VAMPKRDEPSKQGRRSARRKADAVVRLLRDESVDEFSRERRVDAHRLQAWRDEFLPVGSRASRRVRSSRRTASAKSPNARSASSRWSWRSGGRRPEKGASDPAQEAAEIAVELEVARKRVCDVLAVPRSTIYARQAATVRDSEGVVTAFPKRGPKREISDAEQGVVIPKVINESPFAGEGHRKVNARLRRYHGVSVGRKRSCASCELRDCSPRSGPRGTAGPGPTTAPSSPPLPTCCGARTPPWPPSSATAGCGLSA
jgi:hypothetical protein